MIRIWRKSLFRPELRHPSGLIASQLKSLNFEDEVNERQVNGPDTTVPNSKLESPSGHSASFRGPVSLWAKYSAILLCSRAAPSFY